MLAWGWAYYLHNVFFLWKSSHVQRHETKLANFFWHQRQRKQQQEEVIWEGKLPLRQLTFPGSRVSFKFKQQLIGPHSSTIGDFMKTCRELYCEQKNKESCIYILFIKLRITLLAVIQRHARCSIKAAAMRKLEILLPKLLILCPADTSDHSLAWWHNKLTVWP